MSDMERAHKSDEDANTLKKPAIHKMKMLN